MAPKISVIVPIYNVSKYINKCIDSICNQSFADFELILVDDGSTDNCPQICDEYAKKDDRIRVLHKVNGGSGSARKAGVDIAIGEYAVCVDGDDYIRTDALAIICDIFDKYHCEVVDFNYYLDYTTSLVNDSKGMREGLYNKDDLIKAVFPILIDNVRGKGISNSIWSRAYRLDIYKKYQNTISNDIKIGEDCACTKSIIFNSNSLYHTDESLYYYRQNETSIMHTKHPIDHNGPKKIAQILEKNIDMQFGDMQQQIYRFIVSELYKTCATQFYSPEPYSAVVKEIKHIISDEYYANAINKCKFSFFSKQIIKKIALKYKLIFLLKLYSMK